jgi:glycine/D-amino acid oxidase-like deaminating enzyme
LDADYPEYGVLIPCRNTDDRLQRFVAPDGHGRGHAAATLDWLSNGVAIAHRLGTPETTAIVHPRKFTSAIMSAAQRHGTQLRLGRISGIARSADGSSVKGVELDGDVIEADAIVVAMGRWSLMAARWTRLPAVFGQRSPSLVYDTGTDVPADALFLEYQDERAGLVSVEVFPRADGSTLITAFSDQAPLPLDAVTVAPEPGEINRFKRSPSSCRLFFGRKGSLPGKPAIVRSRKMACR